GAVGDRAHAAVIDEPVAIEDAGRDVLREQLLRQRLADRLRLVLLLALGLEAVLEVRRRRQDRVGRVVDRLGVDVIRRPEHREPRPLGRALELLADRDLAAHARRHLLALDLLHARHGLLLRYAAPVLPTLRLMTSSTYLIPLPL